MRSPRLFALCAFALILPLAAISLIACEAGANASNDLNDASRRPDSPAIAPGDLHADGGPPVSVYAAASLAAVLDAAIKAQRAQPAPDVDRTTVRLRLIAAASSTLARQLERGAPPGVFLSANAEWMDRLERRDRLLAASRRTLFGNRLALVRPGGPADESQEPQRDVPAIDGPRLRALILERTPALNRPGRLCLGDPEHVPAGVYARQALERSGVWRAVRDRVLPAADARRTLWYLSRGACALGIVYRTDAVSEAAATSSAHSASASTAARDSSGASAALGTGGVSHAAPILIGVLDQELHETIVYEIALMKDAPPAAAELYEFLFSPAARKIYQSFGFVSHDRSRS